MTSNQLMNAIRDLDPDTSPVSPGMADEWLEQLKKDLANVPEVKPPDAMDDDHARLEEQLRWQLRAVLIVGGSIAAALAFWWAGR